MMKTKQKKKKDSAFNLCIFYKMCQQGVLSHFHLIINSHLTDNW